MDGFTISGFVRVFGDSSFRSARAAGLVCSGGVQGLALRVVFFALLYQSLLFSYSLLAEHCFVLDILSNCKLLISSLVFVCLLVPFRCCSNLFFSLSQTMGESLPCLQLVRIASEVLACTLLLYAAGATVAMHAFGNLSSISTGTASA